MLMKGVYSSNECMLYGVEEVDDSLKGIECLIEAGLIEIAHIDTQEKSFEMLWKDMRKKIPRMFRICPKLCNMRPILIQSRNRVKYILFLLLEEGSEII